MADFLAGKLAREKNGRFYIFLTFLPVNKFPPLFSNYAHIKT